MLLILQTTECLIAKQLYPPSFDMLKKPLFLRWFFLLFVRLSNILYRNLKGREPGKRAHGQVIVFVKVNGMLSFEVVGGLRDFSCRDSSVPSYFLHVSPLL